MPCRIVKVAFLVVTSEHKPAFNKSKNKTAKCQRNISILKSEGFFFVHSLQAFCDVSIYEFIQAAEVDS